MSVYGWVYAHTKDVLMVLSQGSGVDHVSPWACLALVNVDNRYYAGSAGLNADGTSLVELVLQLEVSHSVELEAEGCQTHVEDVFVVGERDDELDHQFSPTSGHCTASPPVQMLPPYAIVLLMETDDTFHLFTSAIRADEDPVEVL